MKNGREHRVLRSDLALEVLDDDALDLPAAVPLGGRDTAAPMTYALDGRQYLVAAVRAGSEFMELLVPTLPERRLGRRLDGRPRRRYRAS